MSTKTLIAGGDSYTEQIPGAAIAWPYWLGFDEVINVGEGGAGNASIFNNVIDAIEKNLDKDLTVIVFWSEHSRLNLFDSASMGIKCEEDILRHHQWYATQNTNPERAELMSEFSNLVVEIIHKQRGTSGAKETFQNIVNHSLRYMFLLEKYCKMCDIKFYHSNIFDGFGGLYSMKTLKRSFPIQDPDSAFQVVKKNIRESYYFKQLLNSKAFMGFNFEVCSYIINKGLCISKHDNHPNGEGHKKIASLVNQFMIDGIRIGVDPIGKQPVYIYD